LNEPSILNVNYTPCAESSGTVGAEMLDAASFNTEALLLL